MKIIYIPIADLQANGWNPNKLSFEDHKKLTKSIENDGLMKAIVVRSVDGRHEIVDGFHRVLSLKELGHETAPCVDIGPVPEEKAKKFTLIGNARYGEDDPFLLKNLFESLDVQDVLETLPFEEEDITNIFSSNILDIDSLEIDDNEFETDIDFSIPDLSSYQTHTIIRFKVDLETASKINDVLSRVKHQEGYTTSDEVTNSGDALSFLFRENGIIK